MWCINAYADNTVSILLGTGSGTFQGATVIDSACTYAAGLMAADMNNDGSLDVVATCYGDASVHLIEGHGDGTFAAPVSYMSGNHGPWYGAVGDVDGDGRPDVVIADINNPASRHTAQTQMSAVAAAGPPDIALARDELRLGCCIGAGEGPLARRHRERASTQLPPRPHPPLAPPPAPR